MRCLRREVGLSFDKNYLNGHPMLLSMEKIDHYTFFLLKPSTLKRRYYLIWTVADQIKKFLIAEGFQIIKERKLSLSSTDIMRFYKDEIHQVSNLINRESAKTLFKSYLKTLQTGPVLLLLVYHPTKNAKALGTSLKGEFLGVQSPKNTIRYIFRDKRFDAFRIVPGKIVMLPCDNVIHSPRNNSEFAPIIARFFPEEYKNLF